MTARGSQGGTRGHESSEAPARPIFIAGAALFAVILVLSAVLWLITRPSIERTPPPEPFRAVVLPRGDRAPPLQVTPGDDLARLDARDRALLDSYGWVDRGRGVARIPVARAVDILVRDAASARAADEVGE